MTEDGGRFSFNLDKIAPDWPNAAEREAEWARLLRHYLPRLRDYFSKLTGDEDLADDIVAHVVRRALLKLHELGSSHSAWRWFTRTGANHLNDLHRRRAVETARLALFARDEAELRGEYVPPDLIARVADGEAAEPGDPSLVGRIPIDRPQWEARLAALTEDDRRLLELIEVEGKTHNEAAMTLGLASAAASRKRHSRARHFLRTGSRAR